MILSESVGRAETVSAGASFEAGPMEVTPPSPTDSFYFYVWKIYAGKYRFDSFGFLCYIYINLITTLARDCARGSPLGG
jgi:hypothetical protein